VIVVSATGLRPPAPAASTISDESTPPLRRIAAPVPRRAAARSYSAMVLASVAEKLLIELGSIPT
jgi:hypothetical protein